MSHGKLHCLQVTFLQPAVWKQNFMNLERWGVWLRSGYADQNFNFRKIEPFHHGRRYLFTVSNSFPLYLIWQIKYDKTMYSMVKCYQHFRGIYCFLLQPWRRRQYVLLKHNYPSTRLHNIKYQWITQS